MPKNLSYFEAKYLNLDPDEFDIMANFTASENALAYSLIYGELLAQFLVIFACLINIRIIHYTAVLHWNLKFILLIQTLMIFYSALIRLLFVAPIKFITGDLFWSENEFSCPPVEYFLDLPLFFRIFLGHFIILERTLATFFAKCYEKYNGKIFSISWISIVLLVTFFNLLFDENVQAKEMDLEEDVKVPDKHEETVPPRIAFLSVILALVLTLISFIEIILFMLIWYYNKGKLSNNSPAGSNANTKRLSWELGIKYDLAKRYQYLENMRTTFQLGPTLLVYFLIQLNAAFAQTYHFYGFIPDDYVDEIITQCSNLAVALFNLLILFTTIFFHPILRQNFFNLVPKLRHKGRIGISVINSDQAAPSRAKSEGDRYFKMLTKAWEIQIP